MFDIVIENLGRRFGRQTLGGNRLPSTRGREIRYPFWYLKFHFVFGQLADFYQQFRMFTLAGIPFADTLSLLRAQAAEVRQDVYHQILHEMWSDLDEGHSLADALRPWCPSEDILLIASGGSRPRQMAEAFERIMKMQKGRSEMWWSLIMTMVDPAIVLVSTYIMTVWTATSYVDRIMAVVQKVNPDQITGTAHELLLLSKFGGWHVLIPPVVCLAIVAAVVWSMPRWTGPVRKIFDSIPPWSIYRAVQGAGWMHGFSMLAEQGVPYRKILLDSASVGTPWLNERCLAASRLMGREGMTLGDALWASGFNFPSKKIALNIKAIGTKPGFKEVMSDLATEWYVTLINNMKVTSNILGVATLLGSTLVLAWVTQAGNDLQNQVGALIKSQMY